MFAIGLGTDSKHVLTRIVENLFAEGQLLEDCCSKAKWIRLINLDKASTVMWFDHYQALLNSIPGSPFILVKFTRTVIT